MHHKLLLGGKSRAQAENDLLHFLLAKPPLVNRILFNVLSEKQTRNAALTYKTPIQEATVSTNRTYILNGRVQRNDTRVTEILAAKGLSLGYSRMNTG